MAFHVIFLCLLSFILVPPPALAAGISPLSIEPAFEQNLGQAPGDVLFLARGRGRTVHLTAGAMIFTRAAGEGPAEMVTMRWVNGSAESAASGVSPLELRTSYYVGTDSADWLPDVPSYSRVRYRGVYPGIDLEFHFTGGRLEYDFLIAPGGDPASSGSPLKGPRARRSTPRAASNSEASLSANRLLISWPPGQRRTSAALFAKPVRRLLDLSWALTTPVCRW